MKIKAKISYTFTHFMADTVPCTLYALSHWIFPKEIMAHQLFSFPTWTSGFSSNMERKCKLLLLSLQQQQQKMLGNVKVGHFSWDCQRTEVEGQIATPKYRDRHVQRVTVRTAYLVQKPLEP